MPDLSWIVAFRNALVHGCRTIDDALVWEVATTRVHALLESLDLLVVGAPETEIPVSSCSNPATSLETSAPVSSTRQIPDSRQQPIADSPQVREVVGIYAIEHE